MIIRRLSRRHVKRLVSSVALFAVVLPSADALASETQASESVVASFEGGRIRLADGWGEASACVSDGRGARCYRSEAEMDAAEGRPGPSEYVAFAACSSSVRLYVNAGHGGNVLQLTLRSSVISLATHGFNNVTSSYKIGACSSNLYDTTSGTGLYPGGTGAGAQATSMASGWDNRIGSVYIV